MTLIFPGTFTSFDISITDPYLITSSPTSTIIFNYKTHTIHTFTTPHLTSLKFYPIGYSLLTLTDKEGLHVWDIARSTCIYKYPENVRDHCYLDDNVVVACSSLLRFYDLRVRTCIRTLKCKGQSVSCYKDKIICVGDKLCICTRTDIMESLNCEAECGIINATGEYFIVKEKGKFYLRKNKEEYKIESNGRVMCNMEEKVCVGGDNQLCLYGESNMKRIKVDGEIFMMKYDGKSNLFYLGDKGVFRADVKE